MSLSVLIALALVGPRQDAPVRVTYRTVAVPLSRALGELSKSTGTNLKAAPALENETVVLAVKDVPLEEVKSRLAKAVTGQWTKDADGIEYLGADVSARAAEARAELQRKTDEIAKSLKELQATLNPKRPDPKAEPSEGLGQFMGMGGSADSKLIAQLSFVLRASDLAAIPEDGRVVYSTTPNAMQRPLNVQNLAKYVSEFAVEHNKNVEQEKTERQQMDPEQEAKIAEIQKAFGTTFPVQKKIEGQPAKLLLVVENGNRMGFLANNLELKLIAFDAKGEVLATGSAALGSNADAMMGLQGDLVVEAEPGKAAPEAKKVDPKLDKAIEFTKLTKELVGLMDYRAMAAAERKPSPELMEHMLRPDLYDPLSYDYSESLMALADAQGLNLVACLPDVSVDAGSMVGMGRSTTLASFKDGLDSGRSVTYEEKDGWASLKATNPASARAKKVDRKSLAKLLGSATKTVVPSLDALSEYASVNPPIMETPVVMLSVMLVAPNALSIGMRGLQDWPMLRLYGLLGQAERNALRQGKSVPFASVSSKAQPILKQMVYGAGARFQVGPDKTTDGLGLFGMASSFMPSTLTSFKEEPTELLPNGLPAQGGLSMNVKPGHFVMADSKGFMATMFGAMGPEEYAMLKYFAEEPKMAPVSAMMPKLDKFRVGDRDLLDVRLHLAPDVTQKHLLVDQRIAKDAAIVGLDGLPKDFVAEVEKQMKLFKDGLSPFAFGSEMFGGRPPSQ